MNNTQGGYKIIDFNGIDLINEETPNTNIYKAIEESYKSKVLLLTNIVIDKVEYNAVFKEIKHIDTYYTFEIYDRIIKVYADKVESMASLEIIADITKLPVIEGYNELILNNHNYRITIKDNQHLTIKSNSKDIPIFINSNVFLDGSSNNEARNIYQFSLGQSDILYSDSYTLGYDVSTEAYVNSIQFESVDSPSMLFINFNEKIKCYLVYIISNNVER